MLIMYFHQLHHQNGGETSPSNGGEIASSSDGEIVPSNDGETAQSNDGEVPAKVIRVHRLHVKADMLEIFLDPSIIKFSSSAIIITTRYWGLEGSIFIVLERFL